MNSVGTTSLFLAEAGSAKKLPLAFWPIPFSSVAFVSKIRSGPRQKGKIGKIWVWLLSSYKCRTGDSGVSGNEGSVEAMGNNTEGTKIILKGESEGQSLKGVLLTPQTFTDYLLSQAP